MKQNRIHSRRGLAFMLPTLLPSGVIHIHLKRRKDLTITLDLLG